MPDLEELEDAWQRIMVVPYALWPDEMHAEFDELVEDAARMLLRLHDLGRIKFTCAADGKIEVELLPRVRH